MQADPAITEEVKYKMPSKPAGVPVWYKNGMLCIGEIFKQHLRVTFAKGPELPDPKHLINSYRSIVIKEGDTLNEKAFTDLVKAAVALNDKKTTSSSAKTTHSDIVKYNKALTTKDKKICVMLAEEIQSGLKRSLNAENKVWHGHPVWFLDGNPVVGYAKRKNDIQLLFWSGQSFDEPGLEKEGTFKAAQVRYTDVSEVKLKDLKRWLKKAQEIQWDYKNIVKRKGILKKIVPNT